LKLEVKGSLSQITNTVENHSRRPEQVEVRISGFEEKVDIGQ
jgi:hypothetical protein